MTNKFLSWHVRHLYNSYKIKFLFFTRNFKLNFTKCSPIDDQFKGSLDTQSTQIDIIPKSRCETSMKTQPDVPFHVFQKPNEGNFRGQSTVHQSGGPLEGAFIRYD